MPRLRFWKGSLPPWLSAGLAGSVLTGLAVLSGQAPMRMLPPPEPQPKPRVTVPIRPVAYRPQPITIQPNEVVALAGREKAQPTVRVLLTNPLQNGSLRVMSASGILVTDPDSHRLLAQVPGNAVYAVSLSPDGRALSGLGSKDFPGKRVRLTPIAQDTPLDIGGRTYAGALEVSLGATGLDVVNEVRQEDYIAGVLCGEVPKSFPLEALKAQAVAARTYALSQSGHRPNGVDVVDTVADQVYLGASRVWPECRQAVQETAGQVATYDGRLIVAYFSADCGGWTRSNTAGGLGSRALPYLQAVRDAPDGGEDFCATSPKHTWSARLTIEDLLPKLQAKVDPDLKELKDILFSRVYSDGRVGEVTVEGLGPPEPATTTAEASSTVAVALASAEPLLPDPPEPAPKPAVDEVPVGTPAPAVPGDPAVPRVLTPPAEIPAPPAPSETPEPSIASPSEEPEPERPLIRHFLRALDFRRAIGTTVLRSQIMEIARDGEDAWIFRGRGYGHAVGLCQWGAKGRALAGQTYDKILKAYYQGISLDPAPARNGVLAGSAVSHDGTPLAGATVTLVGTDREATTDTSGRFRFDALPEGTYDIVVTAADGTDVMSFGWTVSEDDVTQAALKIV